MAMNQIYGMAYELNEAREVLIEQECSGNVDRVILHPIQVRLIASEMGLFKGDDNAWRRVETLERRLETLRDRIATLNERLWAVPVYPPGAKGGDPDLIYSDATLELAEEFCADLPYLSAEVDRNAAPPNAGQADTETQQKPMANRSKSQGLKGQAGLPLEETSE